ncbi:MAG: DUF350 domain-containing protein [Planctomycetia bacterium]|nr:DUF350 domain-containing protein [Planctomycetia bacterium]
MPAPRFQFSLSRLLWVTAWIATWMAMYRMDNGNNPVAVAVAGSVIGVGLLIAFRRQRSGWNGQFVPFDSHSRSAHLQGHPSWIARGQPCCK